MIAFHFHYIKTSNFVAMQLFCFRCALMTAECLLLCNGLGLLNSFCWMPPLIHPHSVAACDENNTVCCWVMMKIVNMHHQLRLSRCLLAYLSDFCAMCCHLSTAVTWLVLCLTCCITGDTACSVKWWRLLKFLAMIQLFPSNSCSWENQLKKRSVQGSEYTRSLHVALQSNIPKWITGLNGYR